MSVLSQVLKVGARASKLSLAQTEGALHNFTKLIPAFRVCALDEPKLKLQVVPFSSPGDRDKKTDLRNSAPDFFTRDLDKAVLTGEIVCAMHSAKDLPPKLTAGLDFLILPWREDSRDVLILGQQKAKNKALRVGVSSERRYDYCKKRFPESELLPIRGNIEDRIAQLDAGHYDVLVMAAAGLKRLGLEERIDEYISLHDLAVPEMQGALALTFRQNDKNFANLRHLFVHPVTIAGAGIGDAQNCTQAVIKALKHCDVCLHDALCPQELLRKIPAGARAIPVGKRSGGLGNGQTEINELLLDYAKKNYRVVRLKGGDPTIFGRLKEEIDALEDCGLPYKVLPGISSLAVATASTGMLLTQRGTARGFMVATPRQAGDGKFKWFDSQELAQFSKVIFMAGRCVEELVEALRQEGREETYPISLVYDAGYSNEKVVRGTVGSIVKMLSKTTSPAICLLGAAAERHYKSCGALAGKRCLYLGSERLASKAKTLFEDRGATFLSLPMLRTNLIAGLDSGAICQSLTKNEFLLVTSPSCAELLLKFLQEVRFDLRKLPKLIVCGEGTANIFQKVGIYPEYCPKEHFGADAVAKLVEQELPKGSKVVWLRSNLATEKLAMELRAKGLIVKDIIFYATEHLAYSAQDLPEFDIALFTSSSSVDAFVNNYGEDALRKKQVVVIGEPTLRRVQKFKHADFSVLVPDEQSLASMADCLAVQAVSDKCLY